MDRFTLEIALGNEAMQTGEDIADALRKVADRVDGLEAEAGPDSHGIRDLNGNTVGKWEVS